MPTLTHSRAGQEPPAGTAWALGQRTEPEGALGRDHHHAELYRHTAHGQAGESVRKWYGLLSGVMKTPTMDQVMGALVHGSTKTIEVTL